MLDYLTWRKDLTFFQSPVTPVDALLLSALSYVQLDGLVSGKYEEAPTLRELSQMFQELSREALESRLRDSRDETLIQALGESRRFGSLGLTGAWELLDEEKELQFAAITLLLEEGGAFVAFRGTDGSLTGWKEDLNLSFLDVIPGQQAAAEYLEEAGRKCPGDLYVAGHSKGGNLAVYAGARCSKGVKERIRAVYNHDGPGFRQNMLEDPGYQEILDRIHTFVPQSSVVGMLLEHKEPYTVVHSTETGLLQHEPYSWEVSGADFVRVRQVTEGSRMVDETIKNWLAQMSISQREAFVDALYELLCDADITRIGELARPGKIYAVLQELGQEDEKTRRMLMRTIAKLIWAAAETLKREPHLPV